SWRRREAGRTICAGWHSTTAECGRPRVIKRRPWSVTARHTKRGRRPTRKVGLVAAGRDQQDVVAIHQHQLPLDGARLTGTAEEVRGRIRDRNELRGKVREHRVQ